MPVLSSSQQDLSTPVRSSIYQDLYPDDLMMATFGTLTPSNQVKSEFYHSSWLNWRAHSFNYDNREFNVHEVKKILKNLGFKDFFDFQIRPPQIRFRLASDLAVARLAGLDRKCSKL